MNAIYQFSIDNNGNLPGNMSGTTVLSSSRIYALCSDSNASRCSPYNGFAVIARHLTGSYIVNLPRDPIIPAASGSTGYAVQRTAAGRVIVTAPLAEQGVVISIER